MKVPGWLVGRAQLIGQNDRVKKFIFTTGLMGGMFFCYDSEREVSQKRKINEKRTS